MIKEPKLFENAFNCPFCAAYAHQGWFSAAARSVLSSEMSSKQMLDAYALQMGKGIMFFELKASPATLGLTNVFFARCASCSGVSVWVGNVLVHPRYLNSVSPNPDMPESVRADFEEASRIAQASPRGAAALLRLCIQKLCIELGQPGKSINEDIGALVRVGLPVDVQRALDVVRVVGNSAVHPGQLDVSDDQEIVKSLLKLINIIIERTISQKRMLDDLYSSLPQGALNAISSRDRKGSSENN